MGNKPGAESSGWINQQFGNRDYRFSCCNFDEPDNLPFLGRYQSNLIILMATQCFNKAYNISDLKIASKIYFVTFIKGFPKNTAKV